MKPLSWPDLTEDELLPGFIYGEDSMDIDNDLESIPVFISKVASATVTKLTVHERWNQARRLTDAGIDGGHEPRK